MFETLFNWLHLVAVTVWIGGLIFLLGVLRGTPTETNTRFVEAAMRFRPVVWSAMAIVILTGVYRIIQVGGMKALPVVVHIKIALALVMVVISLGTTLGLLPKLAANPQSSPKVYVWANTAVVALGLTILWLLVANGLV